MLVAQSCLTLCDMDCSLPSCSVHGILQARILGWVASPFSNVGNSLMVNNSNNNPLQVKATPLPVKSGPRVPSRSLWFRGSGVAGSKSSKYPSFSLGGRGEYRRNSSQGRSCLFPDTSIWYLVRAKSPVLEGNMMQEAGPWPGVTQRALDMGNTEFHQGPGGCPRQPWGGKFPPSAHPTATRGIIGPQSQGTASLSMPSSGNGLPKSSFQADTPENVQSGVSFWKAGPDSTASHGPYFTFQLFLPQQIMMITAHLYFVSLCSPWQLQANVIMTNYDITLGIKSQGAGS